MAGQNVGGGYNMTTKQLKVKHHGGVNTAEPVVEGVLRIPDNQYGGEVEWDAIVAGSHHSFGLKGTTLYAWGWNLYGQLGLRDTDDRDEPTEVSSGWDAIAVGSHHSFGLKGTTLYAWGRNNYGQLGLTRYNIMLALQNTTHKISGHTKPGSQHEPRIVS